MGQIDDLANRYVAEWTPLNPIGATYAGISGCDDQLDDLSVAGFEARGGADPPDPTELDLAEPETEAERIAKESMQERLGLELARYDTGETTSEISVIVSGLHDMRQVFDLMPTEGEGRSPTSPPGSTASPAPSTTTAPPWSPPPTPATSAPGPR